MRYYEVETCFQCPVRGNHPKTCCCHDDMFNFNTGDGKIIPDGHKIPGWCPLPKELSGSEKTPTNNASPKLSTETIESFKEIITGLDGGLSQSEHLVLFEVLGFISR